jgi:hypothetical protein
MKWGPGREPVQLLPGDEVPPPIKRALLKRHIEERAEVPGKLWKDQPVEAQRAWAESNGKTFLTERSIDPAGGPERIETVKAVRVNETRMVGAEAPSPPEGLEPQEAASAEPVEDKAPPSPPVESKKNRKRGRPRRY